MPLTNSTNISFSPGNFTSGAPIGGQNALAALDITNSSNYKWANKTAQLNLGNTNYGYVTFDISYTVTGNADIVGVSFAGPDMPISYSTTLSGLFQPLLSGDYIKLTAGVTKRIYAIVNATRKSSLLPITLCVGRKGTLPSNVTVNVQYNCTDVGPLYSYLTGLHVYSPYDAANTPSLYTYLYSYTPINSWTDNTELYANANFTQPAYPYYYSTGSYVYKVGDNLERSFGEKEYVEIIKKWALGKTRVYNRIEGPKSWKGTDVNGFTTENFVFPTMNNVGKLKQTILSSSLTQPSSYLYYLGAASTAQAAADFFTRFDFNNRVVHTIPGFSHALQKLSKAFIGGYNRNLKFDYSEIAIPAIALGIALIDKYIVGYSITNTGALTKFVSTLLRFEVWINSTATTSAGSGGFAGILGPFAVSLITIIIVLIALYIIYLLLQPTKTTIQEPSITFKYRYANTPYLNNGTRLYTNTALSTYLSEYYCDGIYFYDQTAGTIANKELSYSTNALLNLDPLQKGLAYSTKTDAPDSGSVISNFSKLLALPYCSGKPDTVSGTNTNTLQTATFTPLNKCGDLLTYPLTVTVEIPAGTITTTGSQALANAEAKTLLNSLTSSYAASGSYGQTISGIEGFGAFFTHEIKIENNPNTASYFFNNTNNAGLTVGKYLYYDSAGCLKTFNGYYAVTTETYSSASYYRTFYKTINGAVADILSMASSGATTVTSLVNSATYPIQTTNQEYTSDWYWYQDNYNELINDIPYIIDNNTNPNSLYTTSSLKSGFLTPNTSSFYTYNSISSTASYSEAESGFYYAFNSFEDGYIFAYSTPTTLSINLTEVCFTDYSTGEPYGINISGATGSASSSFYYPVNMTLNAYNGGSLITSFPATASAEGITYVDFPAPITKDSNVTNVTIDSISSPNPNNKILYVGGSFTNCNPTTPAPTTSAPTTAAPTPNPTTAAPTTAAPTTAAPTTAAPTPNPTTAAPTPNPTTAAPTPNPTAAFSAIVSYSNLTAQDACDNPQGSFSMTGNNGTFCLSSAYTATNWTTLPQTTYWLSYNGQVRQVFHPSNSNTVTTINACADCPTPSPTAAPTTAAPTTAAPTPNPTTPSPTTPAPTAAPPAFSFLVNNVGRLDGELACATTSRTRTLYAYDSDFSQAERFYTTNTFPYEIFDGLDRWYSDGVYAVEINTSGYAADMIVCPTPSPTPNPTTAAPTPNPTTAAPTPPPTPPPTNPPTPPPTNPPTPPPTTAAPTTPPTPPPTNPPTPAPTNPFAGLIYYSSISAFDVCNIATNTLSVSGNDGSFCASTVFTGAGWTSLPTGTFWIKWIGDTKVVQVFHASNADNVSRVTGCNECPTPSPTTAPTTAAPTNPPTPPPTNPPTPPPTTPPTTPPTPAPTEAAPPFSFLVTNGRADSGLACVTTAKPVTLYSYDSDFSLADRFYSTNTFPYTPFNGNNLWYSNGIDAVQINTVGYPVDAIVCPTPSPTNPPTPPPTNPPTPPPTTAAPTTPPTPPPTNPPTPPPTNPPTPPPTNPPTPPPTTPPTPPPTNPPTPPPTPSPTETPYYYYNVVSCFNDNPAIARSLSIDLAGVYAASGTCYIIDGIAVPQSYDIDIDAANYQGGSCFVSGCGYTPPPVAPPTSSGGWECEAFVGCYEDPFSIQSYQDCISTCPQP